MSDKELAEKVAEKLGWYHNVEEGDWTSCGEIVGYDEGEADLKDMIFDWPTFGLMVEKADKIGWKLNMDRHGATFGVTCKDPSVFIKNTVTYSINEYGFIKAVCLAFIEIPEIENE